MSAGRLRWMLVGLAFGWIAAASAAGAQTPPVAPPEKYFGHEIDVTSAADEQRLLIDGKEAYKAAQLSLDDVEIVGSTPVVIGASSEGGDACADEPFVIALPPGAAARFYGPIGDCAAVSHAIRADALEFRTEALPAQPGRKWTWTAATGFKDQGEIAFAADPSKGWADFGKARIDGPWRIFSYGQIADQIRALLGADEDEYARLLTGVASGERQGDLYVGGGCAPHQCGSAEALLVADMSAQRVYLAWKPEDAKIVVRPALSEWPAKARLILRDWAKKWK